MSRELCDECKRFDRDMNGGTASFDVWVECNHLDKQTKRNDVDQAYWERNQLDRFLCP